MARRLPKHQKEDVIACHCRDQSCCFTVEFRSFWAISCFCAPSPSSYLPSTHISMRLAGPRSPLNVTYAAFSLYHLPLRYSSRLYSLIVNVLQPNPFFSTGRPTPIFPCQSLLLYKPLPLPPFPYYLARTVAVYSFPRYLSHSPYLCQLRSDLKSSDLAILSLLISIHGFSLDILPTKPQVKLFGLSLVVPTSSSYKLNTSHYPKHPVSSFFRL